MSVTAASKIAAASAEAEFPSALQSTPRIVDAVDASRLTALKGSRPPLARQTFDRGQVAASLPLGDLFLVLRRDPKVQQAFDSFVASEYEANSANFHQWLTAEQIGERVGPAPADIQALTSWLESQGLSVVPGTTVTFVATVAPVSGTGTPTGTIIFSIDEATVATVALNGGKASYTTSTLTAGEHYVLATYSGSTTYAVSGDGFNEVIEPKTPVITPAAGTYTSQQTVTITSPTAGGVIYYTLDGTTPSVFSTPYTAVIILTTSKTVEAVAVATNDADSAVATSIIKVIGSPSVLGAVATPIASTTATLNDFVNSLGLTGSYVFHYGASATTLTAATTSAALTASTTRVQAKANLTGLTSGKTYYFQVAATTAGGVTYGPVLSFTTK